VEFLLVDSYGFVLGVSTLRFFVYVVFPLQCVSLYSVCRFPIAALSLYSIYPVPILVCVTVLFMSCSQCSACHSTVYGLFPS